MATAERGQLPDRDPFAQVLTETGAVEDQAPSAAAPVPVLTPDEVASVRGSHFFKGSVHELGGDSRLLAVQINVDRTPMLLVVGSSIDGYMRARTRLAWVLVLASPVLIGLLAGSGWMLAGAALRPVRRLTEEADEISVNELRRRLPVPESNDEIEHLARTINAMLDRIEAAVANERTFIDDASHELRTPISILRGELELALARPSDEAEVTASLRSALDEAVRLGRLAEDLLALARVRAGEITMRPEPVDLGQAALRVAHSLGADGPDDRGDGSCVGVGRSGSLRSDPHQPARERAAQRGVEGGGARRERPDHEHTRGRRRWPGLRSVDAAGELRALRSQRSGPRAGNGRGRARAVDRRRARSGPGRDRDRRQRPAARRCGRAGHTSGRTPGDHRPARAGDGWLLRRPAPRQCGGPPGAPMLPAMKKLLVLVVLLALAAFAVKKLQDA